MAPCKFFVQGRCTYGTACKNSHEALTTPGTWRSTSTNLIVQSTLASAENKKGPSESGSTQATNTCWFYSQGKCTYGAACRLSHEVALPNIHRLSMRTSGAEALNARLLEKEHGDISSTIFVPSPVQHNSNDRPPPKLKADVPSFTPGAPPTKATTQPSLIRGRDASPVCIFFSKGFCRNGETCHFRHEAPTTFSSPSKQVEQNIPVSLVSPIVINEVNPIRISQMILLICPSPLLSRRSSMTPVSHSKEVPRSQTSNYSLISQQFKSSASLLMFERVPSLVFCPV